MFFRREEKFLFSIKIISSHFSRPLQVTELQGRSNEKTAETTARRQAADDADRININCWFPLLLYSLMSSLNVVKYILIKKKKKVFLEAGWGCGYFVPWAML